MSWALKKAREVWNQDVVSPAAQSRPHLFDMERVLGLVLSYLEESQSQKAETPESGRTSRESAGASLETSTTSTPETGITEPINLPSVRGISSADRAIRMKQAPPSRTTAPTSSTPSTDRTTGPSAQSDEWPMCQWCGRTTRPTALFRDPSDGLIDLCIDCLSAHAKDADPAPDSGAAKSGGDE